MPDLKTTLHLDMLQRARDRGWLVRDGLYGLQWGDPENYDLSVDTSTFGVEGSAGLIVRAVTD